MKIYHMYGNVWEYTSTLSVDDQIINVCLKGGDFKIPSFLLSKDLKMNIERVKKEFNYKKL